MSIDTMKKVLGYQFLEENQGNGGEGGGGGEATTTTTTQGGEGGEGNPPSGGAAKTLLDGDEGGAGTTTEPPKDDKPKAKSLLDDEPPAQEPKKEGEGTEAPKAPTTEEIDAWVKGVPALDLGDGVKWDDAALKAMAPTLMGLEKEKSNEVIKAYADYTKGLAKAQAEAADAFNNGLIMECEKRFGTDLKKVAGYAKKGGAAIFGDKIWNEMKTIPSFANNPDIMERLAEYGRKISNDTGKVTPPGGGTTEPGDVLHRMYGNVKV